MKALLFLFFSIGSLYLFVLCLRLALIFSAMPAFDPLSRFIYRASDPLIRPLLRVIPRWRRVDFATVGVGLLWSFLMLWAPTLLLSCHTLSADTWGLMAANLWLNNVLRLYWFLIIAQVIFSWADPFARLPFHHWVRTLSAPIMRPVQRLIPAFGGIDLSPLVPLLLISAWLAQFPDPLAPCLLPH